MANLNTCFTVGKAEVTKMTKDLGLSPEFEPVISTKLGN